MRIKCTIVDTCIKLAMPSDEVLLDYSKKNLKKVPKFDETDKQNVNVLLLDSNELQKIENIDSFVRVEKVFDL